MGIADTLRIAAQAMLNKYGEPMTVQTDIESGEAVSGQPWHGAEKRTVNSKAMVAIMPPAFRLNSQDRFDEPSAIPITDLWAYVASPDLNVPLTVGSRIVRDGGQKYIVQIVEDYRANGQSIAYKATVRAG